MGAALARATLHPSQEDEDYYPFFKTPQTVRHLYHRKKHGHAISRWILDVIIDHTLGAGTKDNRPEWAQLSIRQFAGILGYTPKVIDPCLKDMIERRIIAVERSGRGFRYKVLHRKWSSVPDCKKPPRPPEDPDPEGEDLAERKPPTRSVALKAQRREFARHRAATKSEPAPEPVVAEPPSHAGHDADTLVLLPGKSAPVPLQTIVRSLECHNQTAYPLTIEPVWEAQNLRVIVRADSEHGAKIKAPVHSAREAADCTQTGYSRTGYWIESKPLGERRKGERRSANTESEQTAKPVPAKLDRFLNSLTPEFFPTALDNIIRANIRRALGEAPLQLFAEVVLLRLRRKRQKSVNTPGLLIGLAGQALEEWERRCRAESDVTPAPQSYSVFRDPEARKAYVRELLADPAERGNALAWYPEDVASIEAEGEET